MENFIRKIFSDKTDDEVHFEFIRFGRGVYENKYLLEGKKQNNGWKIKTSSEFVNFLVKGCLMKISHEIEVSGIIVSTLDIEKDTGFEIENVKKYMGIKQFVIKTRTNARKILELMNKYPRAFYALSFSGNDFGLKIKAKPPKNGKQSNKGEDKLSSDFCSLKTQDKEIVEDLFFDFPDFNEIRIKHIVQIKDIEIPKNIQDPKQMRETAKRKGIIKRIINVDGREEIKEKEFFV
ncbi:hypothetical protein HYV50_05370 [Candidatus Pacearchaeota archaeon]|nr:hypothetical protein [Candidatus Pacearchaeota archaeon]